MEDDRDTIGPPAKRTCGPCGGSRRHTFLVAVCTVALFLGLSFCVNGPKDRLAEWYLPVKPYLLAIGILLALGLFARIVVRPRYRAWKTENKPVDGTRHAPGIPRSDGRCKRTWPETPEPPAERARQRRAVAVMLLWLLAFLATPLVYQGVLASARIEKGRREFEAAAGTLRIVDGKRVLFFQEPTRLGPNVLWYIGSSWPEASSLDVLDCDEESVVDPDAEFNVLGRFKEPRARHWGEAPIQALTPLAKLTGLRQLDLSFTDIGDIFPLSGLVALETLDLSCTRLRDVSPLSGLVAIERLDLRGTPVRDLAPLSSLTALRTLNLNHTYATDLSPLASLVSLEELQLLFTPVTDLSPLAQLPALEVLTLSDSRIRDLSPLPRMTALRTLWLLDCVDLTDDDLAPLSRLHGLRSLHVSVLMFPFGMFITDRGLSHLSGLTGLEDLNLAYCVNVTDAGLANLSGLTHLVSLNLAGCRQITDAGLSHLSSLTSLETLRLGGCEHISNAGLRHLEGCRRLRELHTVGTKITDEAKERFLATRGAE